MKKKADETCDWWHETDYDSDYWQTGCGHAFQFNDGGPVENEMKFCGYCGRKLKPKTTEKK